MLNPPVARAQVRCERTLSQLGAAERRREPVRSARVLTPPIAHGAADGCSANAGNVSTSRIACSYQPTSPSIYPHPSKAYGAKVATHVSTRESAATRPAERGLISHHALRSTEAPTSQLVPNELDHVQLSDRACSGALCENTEPPP